MPTSFLTCVSTRKRAEGLIHERIPSKSPGAKSSLSDGLSEKLPFVNQELLTHPFPSPKSLAILAQIYLSESGRRVSWQGLCGRDSVRHCGIPGRGKKVGPRSRTHGSTVCGIQYYSMPKANTPVQCSHEK